MGMIRPGLDRLWLRWPAFDSLALERLMRRLGLEPDDCLLPVDPNGPPPFQGLPMHMRRIAGTTRAAAEAPTPKRKKKETAR